MTDENRTNADKTGQADELTPAQQAGIVALLQASTIVSAATSIGMDERSLRRWLADPIFAAALASARRELLSQTIGRLHHLCAAAADSLASIAADEQAPPAARVSAARAVLDAAFRGGEQLDVIDRLDVIEAKIGASK